MWVRPGDEVVAAALRDAGHRLDGEPALVVGTLAGMDLEPMREHELDPEPSWATVGALNDRAYGSSPSSARPNRRR